MAAALREWNINECAISFAGVLFPGGGADGEVLTIEMEADDYGDVVGSDGEVARFRTNDRRATATLKLMQTSAMVPQLMAISNADLAALNGAGVGAFQVANLTTGERFEAPEAWIKKQPSLSYGREVGTREFVIRCAAGIFTPGAA
jgi:hypothetical protein